MTADDVIKIATPLAVIIAAIIQQFNSRKADKKITAVHTLVNSSMGKQLLIAATLSRRVADLTGKPEDSVAADEASKLLKDHDRKQVIVDTKPDAFNDK